MGKKAILVLGSGFEEIEAVTVIDTLRRAGVEVVVCGLNEGVVTGSRGVRIVPDKKITSDEEADAIILPGGMPGAKNLAESKEVNELIKKFYRDGRVVAAICASPAVVLAPTGILGGRSATCYPGMETGLGKDVTFKEEDVVIDENVITGRGPATAAEFAFAIVEALLSRGTSEEVKKRMLFS